MLDNELGKISKYFILTELYFLTFLVIILKQNMSVIQYCYKNGIFCIGLFFYKKLLILYSHFTST